MQGKISGEEETVLSELYNHHAFWSNRGFHLSINYYSRWWLFPKLGFVGLTARDYLAVGTIFSSTDTVCTLQVLHQDETPILYSLVFGEGVVNDATSVVLFNAIQKIDVTRVNSRTILQLIGDFFYLFSTSTALGVTFGLVTAYSLKTLYFGRHSTVRELAIMVLMAYLSYMLAELLELSGILTVFFCGILMSHYAWHNVTESSRITTRHIFAMMSFVAETFIFLYVGMDALDMEKWKMTRVRFYAYLSSFLNQFTSVHLTASGIGSVLLVIEKSNSMSPILLHSQSDCSLCFGTLMSSFGSIVLLILLGRAASVFPLSAFSNYMNRRPQRSPSLTFKHQVIIWWAGLMRGAVSIALAFKQFTYSGVTWDPVNAAMITNTIIVVLFTTLVFGFLTKPLIYYMLPHRVIDKNDSSVGSKSPKEDMALPLLSFEESVSTNILRAKDSLTMLIERPVYTVHFYWRKFDDTYMRPIFGGPLSSPPEC
ncbi:sodium/hydrogen exchanger 4 isoform X3 [Durio zibethinus]|uniref:Sodium/hydrogen exchanger 4 isoform X3 n=1 Tax=Durio zibethinus TaxID=66656 RepID=A0A6P5WQV5_DURZI|nr:sodium/hydrogen exchanger 4 isoform X3 [Durio zibethinus]